MMVTMVRVRMTRRKVTVKVAALIGVTKKTKTKTKQTLTLKLRLTSLPWYVLLPVRSSACPFARYTSDPPSPPWHFAFCLPFCFALYSAICSLHNDADIVSHCLLYSSRPSSHVRLSSRLSTIDFRPRPSDFTLHLHCAAPPCLNSHLSSTHSSLLTPRSPPSTSM